MMSQYLSKILDIQKHILNQPNQAYHSSLIMPPPNVTGCLHMGHALNLSIQDAIVRNNHLNGKNLCFIPGADHAGIYTQFLVMQSLGDKAKNMNNDQILDEIWKWKNKSEQDIVNQIKIMDTTLDWNAYKFTLDHDVHEYVIDAFCKLYDNGFIFRDQMIVNWDIQLQTVVSDLEAVNQEQSANMWYIKYYIQGTDDYIEVATTRPETVFADAGVCVHPDDERYKHLIGRNVLVPLLNTYAPIIADHECVIDKGTGAVKIDPSHGFMDFDIAKRQKIEITDSVIDIHGKMCGKALEIMPELRDVDRLNARAIVGAALQKQNLITKIEQIKNIVPVGEKSGTILEPMLMHQWFFDIPKIAPKCLKVLDKDLQIFPNSAKNVYIHYMSNPKPWCISRQLIWGHRIPVWHYNDNGEDKFVVARNREEAEAKSGRADLQQENNVFDTWFSSTMWPILNTLNTSDRKDLYPNAMLITGRDLIFFWVARMIIMGLALTNQVPFYKTYCHSLIYDSKGKKMSKSKGNVINPLDLFDKYGIDTVRFSLLQNAIPDHDIKFSEKYLDKAQKFMIKIWNGMNYCLSELKITNNDDHNFTAIKCPMNQWIVQKTLAIHKSISDNIEEFAMHKASDDIYNFIWDDFCNVYLESTKHKFKYPESVQFKFDDETRQCMSYVIKMTLKMLNPFAPFISQYFWQQFNFSGFILDPITSPQMNHINLDDIIISCDMINFAYNKILRDNDDFMCDLIENDASVDLKYRDFVFTMTRQSFMQQSNVTEVHEHITIPCHKYNMRIYAKHDNNLQDLMTLIKNARTEIFDRLQRINRDLSNEHFINKANPEIIREKQDEQMRLVEYIEMYDKISG